MDHAVRLNSAHFIDQIFFSNMLLGGRKSFKDLQAKIYKKKAPKERLINLIKITSMKIIQSCA